MYLHTCWLSSNGEVATLFDKQQYRTENYVYSSCQPEHSGAEGGFMGSKGRKNVKKPKKEVVEKKAQKAGQK